MCLEKPFITVAAKMMEEQREKQQTSKDLRIYQTTVLESKKLIIYQNIIYKLLFHHKRYMLKIRLLASTKK